MPCWRMHLAQLSAARLSSWLAPALLPLVVWAAPLRLATPLGLSLPRQGCHAKRKGERTD